MLGATNRAMEVFMIKFTTEEKAKTYLKKLNYSFTESVGLKQDKCLLYRKSNSRRRAILSCKYDYLNKTSMDMGRVWLVERF